jgi:hypothetical protein
MTETLPQISDEKKEEICLQLAAAGCLERGQKVRWRLTHKGNQIGAVLYAVRVAMNHNGEPNPDPLQ